MISKILSRVWFVPASVAASLLCLAGTASSSELYDPTISGCGTVNCSSESISGRVIPGRQTVVPFTIALAGPENTCVRLDVVSETLDLEMVVAGPDATVWRNDDRVSGDLRPLIKFNTPAQGFYTVNITNYSATPQAGFFTLRYGVYTKPNQNCSPQTPPLVQP